MEVSLGAELAASESEIAGVSATVNVNHPWSPRVYQVRCPTEQKSPTLVSQLDVSAKQIDASGISQEFLTEEVSEQRAPGLQFQEIWASKQDANLARFSVDIEGGRVSAEVTGD